MHTCVSPVVFPPQLNTHSLVQMKLVVNPPAIGHTAVSMLHKWTKQAESGKKKKKDETGKRGFDQMVGKKWNNIQFVWPMWCSLGGGKDKMADEKGEIFFVICRCSFGVKCQTVNVKGGEERWGQRRSLVITLPPVSLSSPLLCLFFCILKLAVRLFSCCFLKLFASFLTATNILPKGRIYPYICMQRHMLVSTTPLPPPVSLPQARTHNPVASVCLFQRDNWNEHEERGSISKWFYLCARAPINQYLHYTFKETSPCHTGNGLRASVTQVNINEMSMDIKHIFHTHLSWRI